MTAPTILAARTDTPKSTQAVAPLPATHGNRAPVERGTLTPARARPVGVHGLDQRWKP